MNLLQRPKFFWLTNVALREVFSVIVCSSKYNVVHWRYLRIKNFFSFLEYLRDTFNDEPL